MIRAIRNAKPDMVFICSYPNDSVALVRAINEIGVGPSVKLIGGGMVGLQFTPIMENMGHQLNGIVNYTSYAPGMKYPGIDDFLKRYHQKALEAKVDPLGFYLPPFDYAIGQILEQAVTATKSLDSKTLAQWLHSHEVQTIVGPISWGPDGERAKPVVPMVQFRDIKDKDVNQFLQLGKQVIVYPPQFKQGDAVVPFDKARKAK
jgi:branched-chain amino acid transport system substrate-binding protein